MAFHIPAPAKKLSVLLVTALLLMTVALFNGFPLAESDTGAYIFTAIEQVMPGDRSPFYSYFLRYTNFLETLWLSMYAQSLLLAWLLLRYLRLLALPARFSLQAQLGTVLLVVLLTCASWINSYLMPDIFTAILVLGIILYLHKDTGEERLAVRVGNLFVIFLAIALHTSHFLTVALFALGVFVAGLVQRSRLMLVRSATLGVMAAAFWLVMCTMNMNYGNGFRYAKYSHIFMITRLAETGILKEYLHDNCEKKQWKLCPYKDEIPELSWGFLWDDSSPLKKTGGWDANEAEYNAIIHDVFSNPKYVKQFVFKTLSSTLKQLIKVNIADHPSQLGKGSSPSKFIGIYYADEAPEYDNSMQSQGQIEAGMYNMLYLLTFAVTSVFLLFNPRLVNDRQIRTVYIYLFAFLLINAFVTSTFSTLVPRFQNRIFWLLPATNIIVIVRYYLGRVG